MNRIKNDVSDAINRALRDFENQLSRAYRFGTSVSDTNLRDTLANILRRSITHQVISQWDAGYHVGEDGAYAKGIVEIGKLLSAQQIKDITQNLADKPVYNTPTIGDSDGVERFVGGTAESERLGGYRLDDILAAPHLLELANNPVVISGVQKLFRNCPPVLTLMSLWWAFPVVDKPVLYLGQNFHRDADGFHNAALFTYLTDVDDEAGPHQYIEGSASRDALAETLVGRLPIVVEDGRHKGSVIEAVDFFFQDHGDDLNAVYENYLADHIKTVKLSAGHGFITDTFGLHRGAAPTKTPRLIFTARYGTLDNVNADHRKSQYFEPWPWKKIAHRLPENFKTRYVNRLLVE
ncbi:phytanoyl-CoA dioxygenase family protein [Kordiimonas pumila]|uniref:Phytanoyl-CoA dioxygenase n=1 Tax=Kordiimonas pumila TaxID=2161677 RepID=A0ABV7D085_9PROT|nr:hypothetical protein [Kordiimonas pumila]